MLRYFELRISPPLFFSKNWLEKVKASCLYASLGGGAWPKFYLVIFYLPSYSGLSFQNQQVYGIRGKFLKPKNNFVHRSWKGSGIARRLTFKLWKNFINLYEPVMNMRQDTERRRSPSFTRPSESPDTCWFQLETPSAAPPAYFL